MRLLPLFALLPTLLVGLPGCGDACVEGGMVESVGGLVVLQEEHPDDWADPECGACHARAALHRTACSEGIDLEAVRAQVEAEGYEGCSSCHGPMGVEE